MVNYGSLWLTVFTWEIYGSITEYDRYIYIYMYNNDNNDSNNNK